MFHWNLINELYVHVFCKMIFSNKFGFILEASLYFSLGNLVFYINPFTLCLNTHSQYRVGAGWLLGWLETEGRTQVISKGFEPKLSDSIIMVLYPVKSPGKI
jgi:hypothetical protein